MSLEAFISGHSVVTASGSFAAPDPDPSKNVNSPAGSVHLDWSNRASSNTSGYDSDDDNKNIVLAERTSQLMSSYRDYITSGRGEGDEEMNLERIYGEAATKERQHDRSSPQRRNRGDRSDMPPATVFNPRAMRHNAAPLLREWNMANPHLNNPDADLDREMDELWDDASGSSYDKKYRYSHPIYKTRQFKRAMLGIVAVAAIVGMSVGIARASKREALPDWEGELQEALGEELEEKELLHETVGIDPPAKEMEEIPPEAVEKMPPPKPTYDKTQQAEGIAALDDDHMEGVTRHVLCCSSGVDPTSNNANSDSGAIPSAQLSRAERHHPTWYDRSSGWSGTSYSDALAFCSNLGDDTQLCPYEAYCPAGPHHVPLGGYRGAKDAGESKSSRSPIADHPNGWVQVGEMNACVQYTIMDPEDAVSDDVGKGKKEEVVKEEVVKEEVKISDGEVGQADMEKEENDKDAQDEASEEEKEEDAGDAASAIVEHVTGNVKPGPSAVTEELLAKHQEAAKAEHELHHPAAAAATADADATPEEPAKSEAAPEPEPVQARPQPDYQPAAQRPKPDYKPTGGTDVDLPAILHQKFKPLWLSSAEGWNGGSHADAVQFCSSIRGKKLCPYSAMCPEGPGGSVMGGRHALSFDIDGEQYAPVMGGENHWVFVGKGDGDARFSGNERRCMTHRQLEGRAPEWGLTGEKAEVKQHIMCCTVN